MQKFVVIALLIAIGVFFYLTSQNHAESNGIRNNLSLPSNTQDVNKTATFGIYTQGAFRVFTATMYHNLSQDVYIEAKEPNLIKIKKEGITWNDFFSTLPFDLTNECLTTGTKEKYCTGNEGTLVFYLNGKEVENILNNVISDRDSLTITFEN